MANYLPQADISLSLTNACRVKFLY